MFVESSKYFFWLPAIFARLVGVWPFQTDYVLWRFKWKPIYFSGIRLILLALSLRITFWVISSMELSLTKHLGLFRSVFLICYEIWTIIFFAKNKTQFAELLSELYKWFKQGFVWYISVWQFNHCLIFPSRFRHVTAISLHFQKPLDAVKHSLWGSYFDIIHNRIWLFQFGYHSILSQAVSSGFHVN